MSNTSTSLRRYRSSLLFQKDHNNNSLKSTESRLELSNLDYKENLRTKSMTSLISEMCSLRRDLGETKKELVGAPSYEISPRFLEQTEAMVDKVLAVEIEIGRRLRAPSKIKK